VEIDVVIWAVFAVILFDLTVGLLNRWQKLWRGYFAFLWIFRVFGFVLLQSINQSIFIRQCNYKQTTKNCGRLSEQALTQQCWPP